MLSYAHPHIPLDVVEEIFKHLSPYALTEDGRLLDIKSTYAAQATLARCARACRAYQRPAVEVLWREQQLIHAFGVLPSFALASVKGLVEDDPYGEDYDGNEDWPEDLNPHAGNRPSPRTYYHLPGPILSDEWSRFEYYAYFIRSLYHSTSERLDSIIFFYLRQHARDKPLFPNLRELRWNRATPELAMVISPTIRVLRLEERGRSDEEELERRIRRHAFKTQLPSVLRSLPNVQTLELLRLGHEGFWHPFAPGPDHQFVAQNISVLHISEPYSALMKGALAAVSTIQALTHLKIEVVLSSRTGDDGELAGWDKTRIRTFARLRRLQIEANMGQSAVILDAIVAPNLVDVEVKRDSESDPCKYPFTLPEALEPLGNRNASSLRRLYLGLQYYYIPEWSRGDVRATEPMFLTLTKPLLQLRQLRELSIYVYPGRNRGPIDIPLPSMLAAWPMLRILVVEVAIFTPEALRAVVHSCPQLKSLTGKCLSDDFLKLPPLPAASDQRGGSRGAVSDSAGHGLLQLRFFSATKVDDPADISKIAHFLDELFPQLCVGVCVDKNSYVFENQENWKPILLKIEEISSRTC